MNIDDLTYDENGLIPVITQELETGIVLMQAYGTKESLEKTLETGKVHYFSRSRNRLWKKGENSGNYQHVKEIYYDCDCDCVLIKIIQDGGACHTGHKSCFYQSLTCDGDFSETLFDPLEAYKQDVLQMIYDVIEDRIKNPKEGSYTNYLFNGGIDKILKKVGEESAEVIIAAKNEDKEPLIGEICDLIYHTSVLMVHKKISWYDIKEELKARYK